jgi:uncharacterized protein
VHQDGLVHISQLADRFVRDPREVVKAGQIVQVRVLEVDVPRKRIALTMKRAERSEAGAQGGGLARPDRQERLPRPEPRARGERSGPGPRKPEPVYPLAAQLAKLKRPKSEE